MPSRRQEESQRGGLSITRSGHCRLGRWSGLKGLYFLEGSLRLGVVEISIGEWERLTRDGSGNLQRQLDGWRGWAAFDCLFQPRQWLYIKKREDTKRSSEVKKKPFESQTRALMAVENPGVLCGRLPLYRAVLSKRDSFPSPAPSRFSFQEIRKKIRAVPGHSRRAHVQDTTVRLVERKQLTPFSRLHCIAWKQESLQEPRRGVDNP